MSSDARMEEMVEAGASRLRLDGDTLGKAREFLRICGRQPHGSKKPEGICAAVLYIASMLTGVGMSQGKVAKALGVSEPTVRSRYRELARLLGLELVGAQP